MNLHKQALTASWENILMCEVILIQAISKYQTSLCRSATHYTSGSIMGLKHEVYFYYLITN